MILTAAGSTGMMSGKRSSGSPATNGLHGTRANEHPDQKAESQFELHTSSKLLPVASVDRARA